MRTSSGLTVSSRKRGGLFPLVRVLSATTSISRFTQALAGQVVIHHDPIEVGLTLKLGQGGKLRQFIVGAVEVQPRFFVARKTLWERRPRREKCTGCLPVTAIRGEGAAPTGIS